MKALCPKCSCDRIVPHLDMSDNELDKYKQFRCLKCNTIFIYDVVKKGGKK